jgi:DNA segregation ATPase FtsK/SpoIIIE-like protein
MSTDNHGFQTKGLNMAKKDKGEKREAVRRVEFRRELDVKLSDEQIAAASREHVDALEAIDTEIEEFSEVKREHKDALGDIKARERQLRGCVQRGVRSQLVACERLIDYAAARVTERRLDTGAVINERDMTQAEGELVMAEIVPEQKMEIEYRDGTKLLALPAPAPVEAVRDEIAANGFAVVSGPVSDVIPVLTDDLRTKAVEIMRSTRRASTAMLQRRLRLGFVAASGVMDALEREGIISAPDGNGARQIVADLWGEASAEPAG